MTKINFDPIRFSDEEYATDGLFREEGPLKRREPKTSENHKLCFMMINPSDPEFIEFRVKHPRYCEVWRDNGPRDPDGGYWDQDCAVRWLSEEGDMDVDFDEAQQKIIEKCEVGRQWEWEFTYEVNEEMSDWESGLKEAYVVPTLVGEPRRALDYPSLTHLTPEQHAQIAKELDSWEDQTGEHRDSYPLDILETLNLPKPKGWPK